jgi:hypothetical protein
MLQQSQITYHDVSSQWLKSQPTSLLMLMLTLVNGTTEVAAHHLQDLSLQRAALLFRHCGINLDRAASSFVDSKVK